MASEPDRLTEVGRKIDDYIAEDFRSGERLQLKLPWEVWIASSRIHSPHSNGHYTFSLVDAPRHSKTSVIGYAQRAEVILYGEQIMILYNLHRGERPAEKVITIRTASYALSDEGIKQASLDVLVFLTNYVEMNEIK